MTTQDALRVAIATLKDQTHDLGERREISALQRETNQDAILLLEGLRLDLATEPRSDA